MEKWNNLELWEKWKIETWKYGKIEQMGKWKNGEKQMETWKNATKKRNI